MKMRRPVIVAGLAAALLALAAPAYAHVTVSSPGATAGGYAVLTFRVPTESDTASTTAIKVQLPPDFASVSVQPHPGWSFTNKNTKLANPIKTDDGDEISEAVTEIDWRADSPATAIKPGEFDQFNVSAGPLPKVDAITFKAIQTYSDGTVVSWTDVPAPGSAAEPEHPAPTLKLTAAAADPAPKAAKSDSQTGPMLLGGIALGLAVVGLALGGAAFVRTRGRGGPA